MSIEARFTQPPKVTQFDDAATVVFGQVSPVYFAELLGALEPSKIGKWLNDHWDNLSSQRGQVGLVIKGRTTTSWTGSYGQKTYRRIDTFLKRHAGSWGNDRAVLAVSIGTRDCEDTGEWLQAIMPMFDESHSVRRETEEESWD